MSLAAREAIYMDRNGYNEKGLKIWTGKEVVFKMERGVFLGGMKWEAELMGMNSQIFKDFTRER